MDNVGWALVIGTMLVALGILIGMRIDVSSMQTDVTKYEACLSHADVNYCDVTYKEASEYMIKNHFTFIKK